MEMTAAVTQSLFSVLRAMTPSEAEALQAIEDYTAYKAGRGLFRDPAAAHQAPRVAGGQWWNVFGANAFTLRPLAVRILSLCSSSSACERVWSTYGWVHNKLRNKLKPARAKKLVYVHFNSRLAAHLKDPAFNPGCPAWEAPASPEMAEDEDDGEGSDDDEDDEEGMTGQYLEDLQKEAAWPEAQVESSEDDADEENDPESEEEVVARRTRARTN